MTSFVLQPCKVVVSAFVPVKGQGPVVFDWIELCKKMVPSKSREGKLNLRYLQVGAFVGLVKGSTGEVSNFVFLNQDRSGRIDWLLKKDQSFMNRLVEVFRVEQVTWDIELRESGYVG